MFRLDRDHPSALAEAMEKVDWCWDAVLDCVGQRAEHGEQDLAVFTGRTRHLILISSDSVYDPYRRVYPQPVEPAVFVRKGYGGGKLGCEEAIRRGAENDLAWSIVRPPHIYGPGAALGCLPPAFRDLRLPERILAGERIELAGGGWFLHQPVFVDDLARLILSLVNLPGAFGRVFNAPGPALVTMRAYYEALAGALDRELHITEIPVGSYLEAHPESASAVCHRIYDLAPLANVGARLPDTSLEDGMRATVAQLRLKSGLPESPIAESPERQAHCTTKP